MRHLLLLILISACGKKVVEIPDDFIHYTRTFEYEAQNYKYGFQIDNLKIEFGDVPHCLPENPHEVGVCIIGGNTPKIVIKKEFWDWAPEEQKTSLIFHELGHCVLMRDHRDARFNSIQVSIMHTYILPSYLMNQMSAEYFHELFTGDIGPITNKINELYR